MLALARVRVRVRVPAQYGCDYESIDGAVDDSPGVGETDLRLRDLAAMAAIGGLAYGTVRLYEKRRDAKSGAADQLAQDADADSLGKVFDATPMMPSPSWYADGVSIALRWWHGTEWTGHRQALPCILSGWYDDHAGSVRWWGNGLD